ncbi:hypothetical protein BURMUCF1_B0262 [Burkholderia multivorans ATCC BAA-247]|nr:hypothetical protein BURMUCF1_B0262 [Burkholderia multivorans ATCC BAA-247]
MSHATARTRAGDARSRKPTDIDRASRPKRPVTAPHPAPPAGY